MTLFKDCFGDLPEEQQLKMLHVVNSINKIVGLPEDKTEIIKIKYINGIKE